MAVVPQYTKFDHGNFYVRSFRYDKHNILRMETLLLRAWKFYFKFHGNFYYFLNRATLQHLQFCIILVENQKLLYLGSALGASSQRTQSGEGIVDHRRGSPRPASPSVVCVLLQPEGRMEGRK